MIDRHRREVNQDVLDYFFFVRTKYDLLTNKKSIKALVQRFF